jgi:transposase
VSVPPETWLKSTVLMARYSIRSERAFCERLNYDLLFTWFSDMRIDQPAFDAITNSQTRGTTGPAHEPPPVRTRPYHPTFGVR